MSDYIPPPPPPGMSAEPVMSYGTQPLKLYRNNILNRWVFECDYDSRHVAKDCGFSWDKESKHWFTDQAFFAMKLIAYADPETRSGLVGHWQQATGQFQESSLKHSGERKEVAEVYIPVPQGMTYKDYQRVGIEFLVRDAAGCTNTLLGDEMGLGKTIQVIGAINYLSDALSDRKLQNVLIICPASLKLNWARELRKWLVGSLAYGIADSKYYPRHAQIVIINYDILEKWSEVITAKSWDMLVCDEAHYLKNPLTKRSQLTYQIEGKRKIYATGTPIVNRPKELFPLVASLDPAQFPSFMQFALRYCNAQKVGSTWDFNGSSNLPELQARLRSSIMLRRLKCDVLKELPPKTRNIIELPVPKKMTDLLRRELAAYEEREPQLEALRHAVKEAKEANNTEAYQRAVDALKTGSGQAMGDISTLRREVALQKVPLVIDYLTDIWKDDPERKIGLWCHHHEVMDLFMEAFGQFTTKVVGEQKLAAYALKFSGKQSLRERDEIVQRFQNDPRCLLFIGQIQAGGVGITLTAASHCVFAELDWVPGNVTQAEDRHHRMGQHDNVLVEHLVLEGSLDCRIAAKIVAKQAVIDLAMNTPSTHFQQQTMFAVLNNQ